MLDILSAESPSADQAVLVAHALETYAGILGNLHGPAVHETAH
jgi:hypothetical protein